MTNLLTITEACQRLRVSKSSMYALIDTGQVRGFRVGPRGKMRRVDAESLEEFLRSRETFKRTVKQPPRHDLTQHAIEAVEAIRRRYPN